MSRHDETKPKRRRKFKISYVITGLLVAIIAGFIIFRLSSKSKLESKLESIRAAGYPVTGAELNAWYSIPESSENAADIIIEAFSHYYEWDEQYLDDLPVIGSAELPAYTEPMAEEMKALVAEYLSDNKKALDLLAKGSAIEHSRYPVDFTQGFYALMPYLSDVKTGVRMLQLEVALYAENGETQPAVDSVKAMFGIARSFEKEPILISHLVRIGCQALGVSTIERLINRAELTDKQLMDISQILFKAENRSGMIRVFAGERCMSVSFLQDYSSRDIISMYGSPSVASPLIGLYKVVGLSDIDALLYIDYMTKYMEALQLEPHQRREASKAIEADFDKISKIHILLHMFRPAFSKCVTLDLKCMAGLQTARVGVAVERYRLATGHLPEVLSDLVPGYLDSIAKDPFGGEELRYKKLDVGFVAYSIGEDGQDDGGKERLPRKKRPPKRKNEPYTYDITFIVQR